VHSLTDSIGATLSVWIIFSSYESLFQAAGVSVPENRESAFGNSEIDADGSVACVDHVRRYHYHCLQ